MLRKSSLVVTLIFLGATTIDSGQSPSIPIPSTPVSPIKGRLLTPLEGCGSTKVRTTKIVGGSYAKEGAWPWIAAIGYRDGDDISFECGGSLITSRHLLTAGHCTSILNVVRLGAHERYTRDAGPHQDFQVIHAEIHPDFITNTGTDIAILYLDEDVKFSDRIRPICLPIDESIRKRDFIGSNPFVAGWGMTAENGNASVFLRQLQVPVLNNTLCNELYDLEDVVGDFDDSVICAGNLGGGDGICSGDSGGPLMLPIHQDSIFPFFQIGLVSFSLDCGDKNSPDGYVSIPYHMKWIQEMINKKIK